MRLEGEALSNRLRGYSSDTMYIISKVMMLSGEKFKIGRDIVTDSDLNEEEVRAKLMELLNSIDIDSETEN